MLWILLIKNGFNFFSLDKVWLLSIIYYVTSGQLMARASIKDVFLTTIRKVYLCPFTDQGGKFPTFDTESDRKDATRLQHFALVHFSVMLFVPSTLT